MSGRSPSSDQYDVIVIGSGVGGLTAAALLARRGKRVLVVEQHHTAGGNATAFSRPGYSFDIGLHYIGGCQRGGAIPRILAAAGVELEFIRLDPDGSDVFVLPDFAIRVPNDLEAFGELLIDRFHRQERGIRRYLRFLRQVDLLGDGFNRPATLPLVLPRATLPLRYLRATLARLLDSCSADPQLRAVLGGWQVVHALPPSRVSAVVHGGSTMHYLKGAYYPVGGGHQISGGLARSLQAAGGELLLRTRARRIVVEQRRVVGVEIENRLVGRQHVRTDRVISNADIQHTLLDLVDQDHHSTRGHARVSGYHWPAALAVLYLGVRRDLAGEGITNATYAIYPELDVEPCYAATARGRLYQHPYVCMSVPTLKDPDNAALAPTGLHNLQLMSIAPSAPEAWGVTEQQLLDRSYRREAVYLQRKRAYGDAMIAVAERLLPGLSAQVEFREMATPLTQRRYTGSRAGTGYGIALTVDQFLLKRPPARTEIEGLLLAGASLRTMHGIVGTLHSGVAAAGELLGGHLQREILG